MLTPLEFQFVLTINENLSVLVKKKVDRTFNELFYFDKI